MNRFQQGSLLKVKRKCCSDVWVFRWYDYSSGKRIYKKQIIGSVGQIRNRREAEKAVVALRSSINVDIGTPHTISDLAAHYRVHELTQEKSHSQQSITIAICSNVTSNPVGEVIGWVQFERCRSRNGYILFHWRQPRWRN